MFIALGDLVADPVEVPVGQLRLDETPAPTMHLTGGGNAANFCSWTNWLGVKSRLISHYARRDAAGILASMLVEDGIETCPIGTDDEWEGCLEGARLVHIEAACFVKTPWNPVVRRAVEVARGGGALVSIDLGDVAWIRTHGASRTAYQVATLRPDILFASRAAAGELAVPLEGLATLPVLKLGATGCSVFGSRTAAPITEEVDGSGAGDALAAAFCVAFVEGASPLEAAGRAVLVAAAATAASGARP